MEEEIIPIKTEKHRNILKSESENDDGDYQMEELNSLKEEQSNEESKQSSNDS